MSFPLVDVWIGILSVQVRRKGKRREEKGEGMIEMSSI